MEKNRFVGKDRFAMVKAMHKATFEEAVEKNVADKGLVPLCKFIAGTKEFFTSSGCAGRIILLQLPKGESKKEASFHRRWHRKASFAEIKSALLEKTKGEVWFKMEPFILHVGTGTAENAAKILEIMHAAGVKRSGIISGKEGKFIVEMQGTQEMSVPVKKGRTILVEDNYLRFLAKKAADKMRRNEEALRRLERECRARMK